VAHSVASKRKGRDNQSGCVVVAAGKLEYLVQKGLEVPLQAQDIDTHSRRGFEAMDQALKARVEKS